MSSLQQVRLRLRRHHWLATLTLLDFNWHIPIHPRFRRFLTFQVGEETFQFIRLLFGLSIAPRVFTKVVKAVAQALEARGLDSDISG